MTQKMNPRVKKLWLERLRSGLPQTQERLTRVADDGTVVGHCCLGVLCEIAVEQGVVQNKTVHAGVITYDGEWLFLPDAVARWAGVHGEGFLYDRNDSLTNLNDGGASFETIADVIDQNL
jgi:hypothetical protein